MRLIAYAAALLFGISEANAAGFIDAPPEDVPAGYQPCVDKDRQLTLCRIPGYSPPPFPLMAPSPSRPPTPSEEELRHQELIRKLDRIEDAIREGR
jgi:hypothetical protein